MRGEIISIILVILAIAAVMGVDTYEYYELQLQKSESTLPIEILYVTNVKNATYAAIFWVSKSGNYTFVLLNTQKLEKYFSYFSMKITIYSSATLGPVANFTLSYPNSTEVTVYLPAGSGSILVTFNCNLLNNITKVRIKLPLVMIEYYSKNYMELEADITI